MKIQTKNTKRPFAKAFSLVEMLVVIAVIGIIAAIAVPNIGKINDAAEDAKNRRNAQNIASVYAAADAAGLDFIADGSTVAQTVAAIVKGDVIEDTNSPFNGNYFGVPNLGAKEQEAALVYLEQAHGTLKYLGGSKTFE